jgi:hypothetical protein
VFARLYSIRPWEIPLLTYVQWANFVADADAQTNR